MRPEELVAVLAEDILGRKRGRPFLVAIDGVDASGKTTLAKALETRLRSLHPNLIRASIDGFHNEKNLRYSLGPDSPEGYYRHSFDYAALKEKLLEPLKRCESGKVLTRIFDFRTESPVSPETLDFDTDTILLMEGVFMQRTELEGYWDQVIYVHAGFEVTLKRACARDGYLFGSEDEIRRKYLAKYIPGQRLYLEECDPIRRATLVVDNDDWERPAIVGKAGLHSPASRLA